MYDIKIIPMNSNSKELSNGIIFVAYASYLFNKIITLVSKVHISRGGSK
jgi:hypothetical protein